MWKDHTSNSSWQTEEEIKKEKYILAYSIGYLLHQDKVGANTIIIQGEVKD